MRRSHASTCQEVPLGYRDVSAFTDESGAFLLLTWVDRYRRYDTTFYKS